MKAKEICVPEKADEGIAYILGILHGDGYLRERAFEMPIAKYDKDYVDYLSELFKKYGLNPKVNKYKNRNHFVLTICSKNFCTYLSKFGPNKCESWTPPKEIINGEIGMKREYISGLIDTDGSVIKRKHNREVKLYSKNIEGLSKIKDMLEQDGIRSRIYKTSKITKDKNFTWYSLIISRKQNIEMFHEKMKLHHPRKNKILTEIIAEFSGLPNRDREIRKKILMALDDKMTTKEIASLFKKSLRTVKEHLERLEKEKQVIREYAYFNRYGKCQNSAFRELLWKRVANNE